MDGHFVPFVQGPKLGYPKVSSRCVLQKVTANSENVNSLGPMQGHSKTNTGNAPAHPLVLQVTKQIGLRSEVIALQAN